MPHGRHTEPVEGCFGCKVENVGVATLHIKHGANPIQTIPVTADQGARAGRTVGVQKEHWDGRRDATVYAPTMKLKSKVEIS